MTELNYKKSLLEYEESITNQTLQEHIEVIQYLLASINSLYGLLCTLQNPLVDIFPVNSPDRASKSLIVIYSMSAFQFSSTILDLLIKGQYSEAGGLIRSLIESVAYAEYFSLLPDVALSVAKDGKSFPGISTVFKFLKNKGKWPAGGPIKAYQRYNPAAHAGLNYILPLWTESSGTPQVTKMWIRKYNSSAFLKIAKELVIPLLGIQDIFRRRLVDSGKPIGNEFWQGYWTVGHNVEKIERLFPDIKFGSSR